MSATSADQYDVIVAGGGPAGTTTATLVAREGHRVLLLDRERFPRPRIGESLMPATYWTLARLGMLDRMKDSAFPQKHSVQFFSGNGRAAAPFYFAEFDPHESSRTWQVDRAAFDQMLLDNAAASGVVVRQEANVKDVLLEGQRAVGVSVAFEGGERRDLHSKVVVDATGQTALIARKLRLKDYDPKLKHASFFTRFEGAARDCGIDEGATLVLQTEDRHSWFWYIPLPDDQVSVGVVGPVEHLMRRKGDPQKTFDAEVGRCPALKARIDGARQVGGVEVMRDFSYISKRIAGDGWVMAGDAFGFLDPIYSTGVFLALTSAEWAADAINDAFREGDFSGERLGRHGERYVAGMEAMRKLVYAYYDPGFSFPRFLMAHPAGREPLIHLLIGNVFRKPVDGLFEAMSAFAALPPARRLEQAESDP